jgi:pyruvate/2-oxoglutarate dehydrogenase complex dihydrolipoamide acyltransferase (E2) component
MFYKVTVPGVGEDVEEIRVLEWHGTVGDGFNANDLIVEFETHKALVEVRAGQRGILRRVLAAEGQWVQVGLPIAIFSDSAEEPLSDGVAVAEELLVDFIVD